MTAGFYAPLPPARTGVADYAASLLAELRQYGQVEVAPPRCDAALYHLGNNALHAEIYRRALERPGVAVLHDAVLHHFLLGQLSECEYVEEFVYNYGEWNRGLGRELWRGRASSGSDEQYFRYPMLRRIAERSRAVVIHNPAAARVVKEHAPATRVVEIPHLFAPPPLPGEAEVLRYRQSIGLGPGAFVFGVFGYLRESKRLVAVLEAFHTLHHDFPHTALVIAGDFVSSDLERALEPMLRAPGIVRLPYLSDREFWLAARALDVCVNLRFPAAGETSGIAVRMMGIGKPVMLTAGEEWARVPEDACVRIPSGAAERESLRCHMVLLTSVAGVAGAIGERAGRHIDAHHRVNQAAKQYWDLLCESCT
ncbi:MAG TPA: glycosyltransferase [Candidatus Acidoferrales bacterium]|nr:glycosyltransferase [Candidatus Acidoferrales bacterium]